MALEIFKLVGSIFVDNEKANESLSKTDEKAEGVGQKLLSGVKTAGKWAAGITTAAAAGATALYGVASKSASAADEIDKMSQKIGISREAYQELDFILSQNGMDVNALQGGMKTLVNTMQSAQSGTASAVDTFAALGVSITDSSGAMRSQEDVFYDAIAALQGMDNEAERAALANDLFGRSASELAPLLNSGAGSMEELRQKAHDLGLVLSDETIDAGVSFTDTMDQLKRSAEAVGVSLGSQIMPIFEQLAQTLMTHMPEISSMFEQLSPVIQGLLDGILPPLLQLGESIFPLMMSLIMQLLPPIQQITEAVLPVIIQLMETLLPPLIQIVQELLPPLLSVLIPIFDLLGPIIELLQPILDLVVAVLQPLGQLISSLLTPLISLISKLIQVALVPLQAAFTTLSGILSGTVNAAFATIQNAVETIKGVFNGLLTFISGVFTGNWSKAWEGIKSIFSSVFEGLKGAFKIPINWIIDGINSFIRGINKIQIPDWVPLVGGKGFHIGEIPRLASGGVLEKGQMGLLEGTGAEAVVPLENNRKWISAVAEDMQNFGLGGGKTEDLLTGILNAIEDLAHAGLYIDKDKLVGAIAAPLDRKLGQMAVQRARA